MSALELPVIITAITPNDVTFRTQNGLIQCPKCARGEGCGAYPWFQGFLFQKSSIYTLPIQQVIQPDLLAIDSTAKLLIDRSTMNNLSVMTYGLALIGFFLGLSLSFIGLNEGIQLLAAMFGLIVGILLNKPISKFYLTRHLRLQKAAHPSVEICQTST